MILEVAASLLPGLLSTASVFPGEEAVPGASCGGMDSESRTPAPREYLFLNAHDGSQTEKSTRAKINRHVQLSQSWKSASSPQLPLPFQVKFRFDGLDSSDRQASSKEDNPTAATLGAPGEADKRPKANHQHGVLLAHGASVPNAMVSSPGTGAVNQRRGKLRGNGVKRGKQSAAVAASQQLDLMTRSSAVIDTMHPTVNDAAPSRRALHYFVNNAALDLSNNIPTGFWDKLVKQSCQKEPVVRKAVVAVGQYHMDKSLESATRSPHLALEAYQSALSLLRRYVSENPTPSRSVVLICCVLLYTVEQLRNDEEAANIHLQSGLEIINRAMGRRSAEDPNTGSHNALTGEWSSLVPMFAQLDIESTIRTMTKPIHPGAKAHKAVWRMPEILLYPQTGHMYFATVEEAVMPWLSGVSNIIFKFLSRNGRYRHYLNLPQEVLQERDYVRSNAEHWNAAMESLENRVIPGLEIDMWHKRDDAIRSRMIEGLQILTLRSQYLSAICLFEESLESSDAFFRPFDNRSPEVLRIGYKFYTMKVALKRMLDLPKSTTLAFHVGLSRTIQIFIHRTSLPWVREDLVALLNRLMALDPRRPDGPAGMLPDWDKPSPDRLFFFERPGH